MRRIPLSLLLMSLLAAAHAADDASSSNNQSPSKVLVPIPMEERLQSLRMKQDAEAGVVTDETSTSQVDPAAVMKSVDDAIAPPDTSERTTASSAGEAAEAAGQAAAELVEDPIADPLDLSIAPPEPKPLDNVFLDAKRSFEQGRLSDLQALLPMLADYELRAYPSVWALLLKLKTHPDDPAVDHELRQFIELHDGDYIAEYARKEYLQLQADKLNSADFEKFYSKLVWNQTEPDIAAWEISFELDRTLSPEHSKRHAKALHDGKILYRDTVNPDSPALRSLGDKISAQDRSWLWTRVVILIQKRKFSEAKKVLKTLPSSELPASIKILEQIVDQPALWLRRQKNLKQLPARLGVFAALRLSHNQPEKAAKVAHDSVDPKANAFWRTLVWSRIGFTATTKLDRRAVGWYAKAPQRIDASSYAVVGGDQLMAWHARALMRERKWIALGKVIEGMPKNLKNEEVWTYWYGRSLAARGMKRQARREFSRISERITFYGKLASDAIEQPYGLAKPPKAMPTQAQINIWAKNPSIQRAQAFYRMGLYREGHREWNWALRNISPIDAVALASYARQERIIHRMINTSQRSGDDIVVIEQRFPRPHYSLVSVASNAQNLPNAWVYGLIRQESRFMPAVSSSVGARGLMQVMPATAKWLAKHLDLKEFDAKRISELEMNLLLGTAYLRMLYEDMGNNFVLATAAYNAGPNRARAWRAALKSSMEAAVFIETIPFFETREYVKNVLANMHTYSLLTGEMKSKFTQIIGTIEPANGKGAPLP